MFERVFQWALRHGSRLLFWAAAAILLIALLQAVQVVAANAGRRSPTTIGRLLDALANTWSEGLIYLTGGLSSAALPFFCALLIQRIDLWMLKGGTAVAAAPPPAPSWLARRGARLLLALALLHFLAAAISFVGLALQAVSLGQLNVFQGVWLGPLWSAGLLLFASLALDRLDRWLAAFRPSYSG